MELYTVLYENITINYILDITNIISVIFSFSILVIIHSLIFYIYDTYLDFMNYIISFFFDTLSKLSYYSFFVIDKIVFFFSLLCLKLPNIQPQPQNVTTFFFSNFPHNFGEQGRQKFFSEIGKAL